MDRMAGVISIKKLVPAPLRRFARYLLNNMPVRIEVRLKKAEWPDDRFSYQARYINFDNKQDDRVLDIGSGGYPLPSATLLVERSLEPSIHRCAPLVTKGKPLVLADIHQLPFADKSFDFVYCSHILEHVDNPVQACREIIRVGKRGYIETPTFGKDALFSWAKDRHRWHVVSIASILCFFEYSARQLEGIHSSVWRDAILGKWYHPLQEAFYNNQDIFNVMFSWSNSFRVYVFHIDGTVETLNT